MVNSTLWLIHVNKGKNNVANLDDELVVVVAMVEIDNR